jgi:hypothetical protein
LRTINFEKKYFKKKSEKFFFEKFRFLDFLGKAYFGPPGGKVNIMADSNLLATYLKIGVDKFCIKNNI